VACSSLPESEPRPATACSAHQSKALRTIAVQQLVIRLHFAMCMVIRKTMPVQPAELGARSASIAAHQPHSRPVLGDHGQEALPLPRQPGQHDGRAGERY
jgi:hypothetical protein